MSSRPIFMTAGGPLTRTIDLLRDAGRTVRAWVPFHSDAWVVLADHLHCLSTLRGMMPGGDADFSARWQAIKTAFSNHILSVRMPLGEPAWQRGAGYLAAAVLAAHHARCPGRDDRDDAAHMDDIQFNPVKHGPVKRGRVADGADWPSSSFHLAVRKGFCPIGWAGGRVALTDVGEVLAGAGIDG